MTTTTTTTEYDVGGAVVAPPPRRGRRMTKLLSKAKETKPPAAEGGGGTSSTAAIEDSDIPRLRKQRSKSPFKRLLRRTFSRSPQRRRTTTGPATGAGGGRRRRGGSFDGRGPRAGGGRFRHEYDNDVDVTLAPEGEGSNSTSLRDPDYMVDPVGELRLKRRPGSGPHDSVGGSSSYTSRSDSLYDSETSSLNSWRSRESSLGGGGASKDPQDTMQQQQQQRPRLDVRVFPGYHPAHPREKSTLQPNSRHEPRELSSVQEGVSSTPALPNRKSSSSSSRPLRKISNSQVVWKKYAEPDKKHSTRRVAASSAAVPLPMTPSGASTTSSSLCSDASLVTRILLLLLHPESKFFEIIQLVFTPETATVGDLLDSIPAQATESKLVEQQYIGLVRAARHSVSWKERGQPASEAYLRLSTMPAAGIVPGDVLVAIPYGYTRRHVLRLGLQILDSPRIKNLLVDKFRSQMHVPTTITTTTTMSLVPPPPPPPPPLSQSQQQPTKAETTPSPPLKSALRRSKNGRNARSPSPDDFLLDSGTRTPTRRNPRRKVDLDHRDPTPPPPQFFERNTVEEDTGTAAPAADSGANMPATSFTSGDGAAASSPSRPKGRDQTPLPSALFDGQPETLTSVVPSLDTEEEASPLKRVPVQPISSQSLLAADAIRRDDSSAWSDSNGNVMESGSTMEERVKEESMLPEEADGDVLEMKMTESDNSKSEPVEEVAMDPQVPREVSCDPKTIQPTLSHDEEPTISSTSENEESDSIMATDKLETNPSSPVSSHEATSYCIAASLSPVRRRINELEEKIAVCPVVPVPEVGPHEFSRSSDASEDAAVVEDGGQSLIGTVVEKCDNDDLPDLTKEPCSDNLGDADSVLSMDLMSEHKEILREALAQLDSLPSRPGQSLEMFLKCRSVSSRRGKESSNDDDEEEGDDDGNDNTDLGDDSSSRSINTGDSRGAVLAAVGGQYDEGSVDESYSAWSNSVDSSLVSRYSLLSHSHRSLMTTEEAQECQIRAKKLRLRRRQKARLRRSLKKLALISLAIILFLYWVDSKSQQWLEGTGTTVLSGWNDSSSLGFFGILQFVVALLTLVKVQILWKKSTALRIENKSCPFLDGIHASFAHRFPVKTKKN